MAPKKAAKVAPVQPAHQRAKKKPPRPVNCTSVKPNTVGAYVRRTYAGTRISDPRGYPIVIASYKRSDPVKGGKPLSTVAKPASAPP